MSDIEKLIDFLNENDEYKNALEDFIKLPDEYKKDVLNYFVRAVEKNKLKLSHKTAVEMCRINGHKFSNWQVDVLTIIKKSLREYTYVYKKWYRSCERCGYIERVNTEPKELLEERIENKRKEKLLNLDKK